MLLNKGRCSCRCGSIMKLPLQFHIWVLSTRGEYRPAQRFKGKFAAVCEISFGLAVYLNRSPHIWYMVSRSCLFSVLEQFPMGGTSLKLLSR